MVNSMLSINDNFTVATSFEYVEINLEIKNKSEFINLIKKKL